MNVFATLDAKTRLILITSTTLLMALALALLLFGHNSVGHESSLIHQAAEATRADMLYSHPEGH